MIASSSIPDEVWISLNSLQLLLIVYLAIICSKLRERIAKLEGKYDQYQKNHTT